jgi:ABC-type nitrate/sulfonate/bicarbonate transport system substrate-binding protein
MVRSGYALAAIGMTALAAAGVTSHVFTSTMAPQRLKENLAGSLRLDGAFGPAHAGEMVADRAGFFKREGLRIVLRTGTSEEDPIKTVLNGTDTIGVVNAETFLLTRSKGHPIVAFAGGYLESPVVFFTLQRSGIHSPSDFIGKRIGYRARQDSAVIYVALMEGLRLARSRVHEVSLDDDPMQLINGLVDVWPGHIGDDSYALFKAGASYDVIRPANYGLHVPGTVYFTTEKVIKDDPRLIRRFLKALIRGWQFANDDFFESEPLIAAFNKKLTAEFIRFSLGEEREYLRPFGARFGEFDMDDWRTMQKILVQQRIMKEPIDLSGALTWNFLRDAYRKSIATGE